jgi:transposase
MLVMVGVDTHTDVHVAAVLDPAGRLLETRSFRAATRGYAQLATWAESFGQVDKVGMEGTGIFGAGLLRFLADYGLTVIEIDAPTARAAAATASPIPSMPSPPPAPCNPDAPPAPRSPATRKWR